MINYLENRISVLNSANTLQRADSGMFLSALMEASSEFTSDLGPYILANLSSPLVGLFGTVVAVMARRNLTAALNLVREALKKEDPVVTQGVAWALGWGSRGREAVPDEIEIIKTLALSADQWVKHNIVEAIKRFPKQYTPSTLESLLSIDITDSREIANTVLGAFEEKFGGLKIEDLTDEQLRRLFGNLIRCPSIDDFYISLFLRATSYSHPTDTLKMLIARIDYQVANPKLENYTPLPFEWRESESLNSMKQNSTRIY